MGSDPFFVAGNTPFFRRSKDLFILPAIRRILTNPDHLDGPALSPFAPEDFA
jgi:hypothetical protein